MRINIIIDIEEGLILKAETFVCILIDSFYTNDALALFARLYISILIFNHWSAFIILFVTLKLLLIRKARRAHCVTSITKTASSIIIKQ